MKACSDDDDRAALDEVREGDNRMSEAFILCLDLALKLARKLGRENIRDQFFELDVDAKWRIAVNAKNVVHEHVPPFHVLVSYNGFPAGIIGAHGGVIAAGECANEETLCAALRAAGAEVPA
jgi:hypothetical protein